ncbi:MAG: hypothetical protein JW883_11445 [Deltaproteobacteria bacterium]|nr:hypothetical protein [Deltaproteobacteria bacterium]
MKTKVKAAILAGAFLVTTAVPMTALARRGGGKGGPGIQKQTQTDQVRRKGQRLRLRDGSCQDAAKTRSGAMKKKGNTYGPGDGTGNAGGGPKDGTGYGAPSDK